MDNYGTNQGEAYAISGAIKAENVGNHDQLKTAQNAFEIENASFSEDDLENVVESGQKMLKKQHHNQVINGTSKKK